MQNETTTTQENEKKLENWRKRMSELALHNDHNSLPPEMRIKPTSYDAGDYDDATRYCREMCLFHEKTFVVVGTDNGYDVVEKLRGEKDRTEVSKQELEKQNFKAAFADFDRSSLDDATRYAGEMSRLHNQVYVTHYNATTRQWEVVNKYAVIRYGKFGREENKAVIVTPTHNPSLPIDGRVIRVYNRDGSTMKSITGRLVRIGGVSTR